VVENILPKWDDRRSSAHEGELGDEIQAAFVKIRR